MQTMVCRRVRFYGYPKIYCNAFRLCAIALPTYVTGLVISGVAFERKLAVTAVVLGWGIREIAVMIDTAAVCKYEIS